MWTELCPLAMPRGSIRQRHAGAPRAFEKVRDHKESSEGQSGDGGAGYTVGDPKKRGWEPKWKFGPMESREGNCVLTICEQLN